MITTITKMEAKTFQGKPQGFKITLADGTEGNLAEKESDKGLREGDSVECTVKDYVSKAGNHSNLLTLKLIKNPTSQAPQSSGVGASQSAPPQRPTINVGAGKSVNELKADACIKSASLMIDSFIADKVDWAGLEEKQRYLSNLLCSEIDDIFAAKS